MNKYVVLESPYFVKGDEEATKENVKYAELCLADCLNRKETTFASHLLYTRVLDDNIPEQRAKGIENALKMYDLIKNSVIYIDKGISPGMEKAILFCKEKGDIKIEFRALYFQNFKKIKEYEQKYGIKRTLSSFLEDFEIAFKEEQNIKKILNNIDKL